MRIIVYGDPHWCKYSSIVRKRGKKYSLRLENLINSINWVEKLSYEQDCSLSVCLGDFFDNCDLNSEELTALSDINWNDTISHYFIVGNHEMGINDLSISSSHLFQSFPNIEVVDTCFTDSFPEGFELTFIPYILEENRKPINEYISLPNPETKRILFMHNDIKGIQMGKFISKAGFEIDEIENYCDICFNGHIHNKGKIGNKIINAGNITGQNFSEDASIYNHCAYIIDTDTLTIEEFENPFAFNFYKIDFTSGITDFEIKDNAVCTIRCFDKDVNQVKEWIHSKSIVESRIVLTQQNVGVSSIMEVETFTIDHIKQFNEFVLSTMDNTDILLEELSEVSK